MPDGLLTIATPAEVRAVAATRGADGLRRAVRGQCAACCGPCPALWRARPCNPGSAFCPPTACELYVCTTVTCCDGAPPQAIGLGSIILFGGICYRVIDQVSTAPPGALVLGQLDFCGGGAARAYCLPAGSGCDHPACTCNPVAYLYWQGCPCPGGAGGGSCLVISLADYAALAASLGSECVVANAGGQTGCVHVSFWSPRADSLPPGCIVFSPPASQVTDTCCDCCPGCASARIPAGTCAGVQATNPKWACVAGACCCQRVRYRWSFRSNYTPAGAPEFYFNVRHSGEATVDFTLNPAGVVVPVTVEIDAWYGQETQLRDMALTCGAHTISPVAMDLVPVQFAAIDRPVPDGQVDPVTFIDQAGEYGCARYRSTARCTETTFSPPGTLDFEWKIEAFGSPTTTCGRGCSGRSIIVRPGPCQQPTDPAGAAGEVVSRESRIANRGSGCSGCGSYASDADRALIAQILKGVRG